MWSVEAGGGGGGGGGDKVSLKEPLQKTMGLVLMLGQILYGPQRCLPAAVCIS